MSEKSLNSQMFNAYRLPEGLVSDVYHVAMSYKWYYSSLVESWHGFVDDISFVCNTRVIRHRWNCQSLMPKWRHEPWAHYVIPYTPWFSVIVMGAWYTVISLLWNATLFCIPRSLTCSPTWSHHFSCQLNSQYRTDYLQ